MQGHKKPTRAEMDPPGSSVSSRLVSSPVRVVLCSAAQASGPLDGWEHQPGGIRQTAWMDGMDRPSPPAQLTQRRFRPRARPDGTWEALSGPRPTGCVVSRGPLARQKPPKKEHPVGLTAQTGRAWSHPELHCLQLRCAVRVSPDHPIPAGAGSRAIYHSVHGPVPSPTRPPPPPPPSPPSCRNAGHPRQPVDRRSSSRHAGFPSSCDATRSDIATTVTHQHHHYHHQSIAATARSAASSRGKRQPPPLQEAAAASFLGVPVAGQARAGAG